MSSEKKIIRTNRKCQAIMQMSQTIAHKGGGLPCSFGGNFRYDGLYLCFVHYHAIQNPHRQLKVLIQKESTNESV